MNAFEPLIWMLIILLSVRLAKTHDVRLLLPIGIGLENKHTLLVYVGALALGILATPNAAPSRHALARDRSRGRNGVDSAEPAVADGKRLALARVLSQRAAFKNVPTPPKRSIVAQLLFMNPIAAPIWIARSLLAAGASSDFLDGPLSCCSSFKSRQRCSPPDRIAAVYPALLAAGAVVIGGYIRNRLARGAVIAVVGASAAALMPLINAAATPEARRLPGEARTSGTHRAGARQDITLPQLIADRAGWESFVDDIDRVYHRLPEDDRRRAVVYVPDYGHAGALEMARSASSDLQPQLL
jgi:hypothetical protein